MKNYIAHTGISRTLSNIFFFRMRNKIYFYLSLKELAHWQRIHMGNNNGNRFWIVTFLLIVNPEEVEKYPEVVGFYPLLASAFS